MRRRFDRVRERVLRCAGLTGPRRAARGHLAEGRWMSRADNAWITRAGMLVGIVVSMRPRQWIKNLIVFAALIFAKRLADLALLGRAGIAFLLFCATSGAVYIVNDLFDADRDRKHPVKSRRPLAARSLGVVPALAAVALL